MSFILGQYKYRNYYAQGIFWEKSEHIIGKVKVLKELNYEARWEIRINQEDSIYQKILRELKCELVEIDKDT